MEKIILLLANALFLLKKKTFNDFFGDPINHEPVGTPKKCTKMLTSIYFKTNHSRMPMKLTQIFSEENKSHRGRSIPIGANRGRGAPKKLLSGLRTSRIRR